MTQQALAARVIVAVVGLFSSAQAGTVIYVDDDNCPGPGIGMKRPG